MVGLAETLGEREVRGLMLVVGLARGEGELEEEEVPVREKRGEAVRCAVAEPPPPPPPLLGDSEALPDALLHTDTVTVLLLLPASPLALQRAEALPKALGEASGL